jgi:hypothetical protein
MNPSNPQQASAVQLVMPTPGEVENYIINRATKRKTVMEKPPKP